MNRTHVFTALGFVTLCVSGFAADFPPVDKLPGIPGLPDPLIAADGRKVVTTAEWITKRRPELKAQIEHYMYGTRPKGLKVESMTVTREDANALGGKATLKEIAIKIVGKPDSTINLQLVVPNASAGRVPVFVGANFYGNHTTLTDPAIPLPTNWVPNQAKAKDGKASAEGRGFQAETWAIEANVDRGYAVATFYCGDVAPDHPGFADGIFAGESKADRTPSAWGAVAAWAWGIEKSVDYLVTDKRVDPSKIIVVGHSRLGKAAILAGALDDRIALVTSHQAGCGGTAPSRGKIGESVKQINERFPHWFAANFHTFNDATDQLPFDQNGLFSLVAPRPLLLTNGVEDTWANPAGQFEALRATSDTYELFGFKPLKDETMPAVGTLSNGVLGYHIRPGKHSMILDDWKVWWAYAEVQLGINAPK